MGCKELQFLTTYPFSIIPVETRCFASQLRVSASRLSFALKQTRDARHRVSTNATNQRREASRLYQCNEPETRGIASLPTNQRREVSRLYQCNEPETRGIASLPTNQRRDASRLYQCNEPETRGFASLPMQRTRDARHRVSIYNR
ncbi:MAG TPA: hypothetical protein ENF37_05990 [Beggiatoa sp.]|nr:hypothetical protein [Beggiatoa sp.]